VISRVLDAHSPTVSAAPQGHNQFELRAIEAHQPCRRAESQIAIRRLRDAHHRPLRQTLPRLPHFIALLADRLAQVECACANGECDAEQSAERESRDYYYAGH